MGDTDQDKDLLKPPKPNKTKLLMVPDEVLETIMSFISYDEVSRCRLVCQKFNSVSQRVLNRGFRKVEKYNAQCLKKVKEQLPRRKSESRKHHLANHWEILNTVKSELLWLRETFLRFIDLNYCCFIPGKLLDEIYRVLRYVSLKTLPIRAHEIWEVLEELRDLSPMAMEYFIDEIAPTFKKQKDPVPKIHAGIIFPQCVGSSSKSSLSSSSNQEAKFQKMSLCVSQLLSKQKQSNKDIAALRKKDNELAKKCKELEKLLVEQQKIAEQKNKEHEKQIAALSKHLKVHNPIELNEHVQYIKTETENPVKELGVVTNNRPLTFKIKREPTLDFDSDPDCGPSAKRKRLVTDKQSHLKLESSLELRTAVVKIEKMASEIQLECTSTSNKNKQRCPTTVVALKVKEVPQAHRRITRSSISKNGR